MDGLEVNNMTKEEVLAAIRALPPENAYVWDGVDEDDRPPTAEEMQAGREEYLRLYGSANMVSLDIDVMDGLRALGQDMQTRVNDVMREWLRQQKAA